MFQCHPFINLQDLVLVFKTSFIIVKLFRFEVLSPYNLWGLALAKRCVLSLSKVTWLNQLPGSLEARGYNRDRLWWCLKIYYHEHSDNTSACSTVTTLYLLLFLTYSYSKNTHALLLVLLTLSSKQFPEVENFIFILKIRKPRHRKA